MAKGTEAAELFKYLIALLRSVVERLDAIDKKLGDVDARVGAVEEGLAGLGKRLEPVEYKLGGPAGASLSRLALRELERVGYQILDYRRNVTVGVEMRSEIDLIVYARRGWGGVHDSRGGQNEARPERCRQTAGSGGDAP